MRGAQRRQAGVCARPLEQALPYAPHGNTHATRGARAMCRQSQSILLLEKPHSSADSFLRATPRMGESPPPPRQGRGDRRPTLAAQIEERVRVARGAYP